MTYTDEELLDALRAFADEHGRPPTAPEANDRDELPSSMTFANHFGSWNAAVAEAGFEPRDRRRSDEELLDHLREFADKRGACPTVVAVRARGDMATPPTYVARFGSWNETLDATGLPTHSGARAHLPPPPEPTPTSSRPLVVGLLLVAIVVYVIGRLRSAS